MSKMSNTMFKKSAMAVAVAAMLGSSGLALADATILFDRDGGANDPIKTDTFVWNPGSMLLQNIVKDTTTVPALGAPTTSQSFGAFNMFMQGSLASFQSTNFDNAAQTGCSPDGGGGSNCNLAPSNFFFFQLSVPMTASLTSVSGNTTTIGWTGNGATGSTNGTFTIYRAATNTSNQTAGTGFSSVTAVLSGKIVTDAGTGGSFSLIQDPTQLKKMDGSNADNYTGIGTYLGNGNAQFDIQVLTQDFGYFISDLRNTVVDVGVLIAAGGPLTPFAQTNPSALVVGQTPFYGNDTKTGVFTGGTTPPLSGTAGTRIMDDLTCGVTTVGGVPVNGGSTSCDVQAQTQPSTSFNNPNEVPEPGSLALLGLGVGMLGYFGRRQRNRRTA